MQTHEGIVHDTKFRLNAELVSAEARFRMETLRLHGRILRLRREKEELKSNTAKLSIENEELLDRLIKVELECCNALHQLKREKERSKLAIETMMERALEKDKEEVPCEFLICFMIPLSFQKQRGLGNILLLNLFRR